MKIQTTRFGEIDIAENDLLNLPAGLIGFPECTRLVLLEHSEDSPFQWLQSIEQPELAFVVIDPLLLIPDYPIEKLMGYMKPPPIQQGDVALAVIATVPPAPQPITVNLVAPLVFNAKTRQGSQSVLTDKQYTTRHVLAHKDDEDTSTDTNEEEDRSASKGKPK